MRGASSCPRTVGEEIQMVFHSNVFEALQELRDAEWDAVLIQLPVNGWSGEELLEECDGLSFDHDPQCQPPSGWMGLRP